MKLKNSSIVFFGKIVAIVFALSLLFSLSVSAELVPPDLLPADEFAGELNPARDYLTVVNYAHPYEFGGYYDQLLQADLVPLANIYGETEHLERAASLAFSELQIALKDEGMDVWLFSGYRTYDDQQEVYDYYGNLEGWAETNKVLEPGYTEHHTGLLLNVVILYPDETGEEVWHTETAERQATIPYFRLLHETLADYGFIDRYPPNKEAITGVPSEPYEIRFVGSSAIAHEIMDNNLTLEEYINSR